MGELGESGPRGRVRLKMECAKNEATCPGNRQITIN